MNVTQRQEVHKQTITGGGGAGQLGASVTYLGPFDLSRGTSLLVDVRYVKTGVDLTIGVVELRSDSGNATIAALYFPRASVLTTTGVTSALRDTHSITATTTGTMVVNTGGLAGGACYIAATLSGAGVAGDVLSVSAVVSEGV